MKICYHTSPPIVIVKWIYQKREWDKHKQAINKKWRFKRGKKMMMRRRSCYCWERERERERENERIISVCTTRRPSVSWIRETTVSERDHCECERAVCVTSCSAIRAAATSRCVGAYRGRTRMVEGVMRWTRNHLEDLMVDEDITNVWKETHRKLYCHFLLIRLLVC